LRSSRVEAAVSWPLLASRQSNVTVLPDATVAIGGMAGSQARWDRSRVTWNADTVVAIHGVPRAECSRVTSSLDPELGENRPDLHFRRRRQAAATESRVGRHLGDGLGGQTKGRFVDIRLELSLGEDEPG